MPTRPVEYLAKHFIPPEHFDLLATGDSGLETTNLLRRGEYSRRLTLLRALLDSVARDRASHGPLPGTHEMWELLASIQRRAPAQFYEIMMRPQTGMWMAHSIRRLRDPSRGSIPLWVDIGYVFNIALAAAAIAGLELRIPVPYRDGNVMIPAVGLARLTATGYGIAQASVDGVVLRLRSEHCVREVRLSSAADSDGWWRLRRLRSSEKGFEFKVWLDDVDPYREIGEPIPPDRIPDSQAWRWQELFEDACSIISGDNPRLARTLAAGLTSIVPLSAAQSGPVRSASSGDSSGSALISLPPDPVALAVTMVHEFQHIKLGELLHLLPLCEDDGKERLYAPWRDDPRPTTGFLQGVYAFFGITEFWRTRRKKAGIVSERRFAEFEFAVWREHAWQALKTLRADAALTDLGRRFADGMASRMHGWRNDAVDPEIAATAAIAVNDHRTEWRIRHVRPGPEFVANLARLLREGGTARLSQMPEPRVVPNTASPFSHQRVELARLIATRPAMANAAPNVLAAYGAAQGEMLAADLALLAGDCEGAAVGYAGLLGDDPDQPDAWTGLVLALVAVDPAVRSLLDHPELLPAIYSHLSWGPVVPDPRTVARWLCG